MTHRIRFGPLDELTDGKMTVKRLLARRFAVLKRGEELLAFDADCRHMRAPLEQGALTQNILKCPWHGWEYDLRSGACLTTPGMTLRHYPIIIEEGQIFLVLGE